MLDQFSLPAGLTGDRVELDPQTCVQVVHATPMSMADRQERHLRVPTGPPSRSRTTRVCVLAEDRSALDTARQCEHRCEPWFLRDPAEN
jgi:hypothetical protein